MLSAHPDAHCVETRAWGNAYLPFADNRFHVNTDRYASFLQPLLRCGDPASEEDRDALASALHGATLEWAARRTRKPFVGEKATPLPGGAERAIRAYHAQDPDMPVIHLVRDPRDVVVSAFVHHTRAHPPADPATRATYQSAIQDGTVPDDAIRRWIENWADVANAFPIATHMFHRCLEVRYEDLVADTPQVLGRMLRHVGLSDERSIVDACVRAASFESLSGRERGAEDRTSFFRKGTPGDWVNWLTPAQAQRIETACGKHFDRLYGAHAASAGP